MHSTALGAAPAPTPASSARCSRWPRTISRRRSPVAPTGATSTRQLSKRLGRNPGELFDRRQARGDLRQPVVPEGPHSLLDRGSLELLAARPPGGKTLELLAHAQ